MNRMQLEEEVMGIVKKIGPRAARDWIHKNFGVSLFSKLDNKCLLKFCEAHRLGA